MMKPGLMLHQRVARRVFPVVVAACVLLGVVAAWGVRAGAAANLEVAHQLLLADLTQNIASEFDDLRASLLPLAADDPLITFATEALADNPPLGVRSAVLGRFLEWMSAKGDLVALRYVHHDGRVLIHVANTPGGSAVIQEEERLPAVILQDVLADAAGHVMLLSPQVIRQQADPDMQNFLFIVPVRATIDVNNPQSGAVGALVLEVETTGLLHAAYATAADADFSRPGRRVVVVNNQNQPLADSDAGDVSTVLSASLSANEISAGRTGRSGVDLDGALRNNLGEVTGVGVGSEIMSTRLLNLPSVPDAPWRAVLIDEGREIYGTTNTLTGGLVVLSFMAGLAIAYGGNVLLRRALQPFEQASSLAQRLAADEGVTVSAAPTDDALTQSVVQMSQQIKTLASEMDQQRQQLRGNLEIAARISRETSLQQDMDTLMDRILHLICTEYQFHHAQIWLLDDVGEYVYLAFSFGPVGAQLLQQDLRILVYAGSPVGIAVAEREPQMVHAMTPDNHPPDCLDTTRARLALPLVTGESLFGALDIQSTDPAQFVDQELQAFELLADQVSIAIYNIRLLQQSDERVREINALNRELTRASWADVETRHDLDNAYYYDLREVKPLSAAPEISNAISMPIEIRGHVVGVLDVAQPDDGELTADERAVLQAVADRVALAIERARLFQNAESERATLSSILDTLPSGVLVLDPQTLQPLQINDQVEQLLGQPLAMDRPFSSAYYRIQRTGTQMPYHDSDLPIAVARDRGTLTFADDLVVVQPDGTQVDLLMNAAPIKNPDGSISMIVATLENISSLRGLENALQNNLRETVALYEASRALSEAGEMGEVLEVIIVQLAMIEPHDAAIVLLDQATQERRVAYTLVQPAEVFELPNVCFDDRQPVWMANVAEASEMEADQRANLVGRGLVALGTMPLRARARDLPLAWLVLAYQEPHQFSIEVERYLTTIADTAATALDNRYLFQSTQEALQEASILYQVSRALTDVHEPQDILQVAVDYLAEDHFKQIFIALLTTPSWDSPEASADVVAGWVADEQNVDLTGVSLRPDQFPVWKQLASNHQVVLEDVEQADYLDEMACIGFETLGVRAVVVMPLRVANRAIGAIWMGAPEPQTFSARDYRIYQSFAEQTSISLEASYLFEQVERRAGQLQTSAQVSQFASSILDLDMLLPRLVDLIKSAFDYDHVQIFLMDREDRFAVLRASTGEPGKQLLAINHKLEKGSASVIGAVTAEKRPVIALDTGTADVVHKPNPYLPHTRSEMALPLLIKGRVVGALDVQSNHANAFDEEDVSVLTTLAAQISVAIDNARLFEQAEHRASDMSLLFAVTTAAASAESLAEALHNVAGDLRDSLDALTVGIYLPVTYVDEIIQIRQVKMRVSAIAGLKQPLSSFGEIEVGDTGSIVGLAAANTRAHIINKVAEEPLYAALSPRAESAVVVPLTRGRTLIGLIIMENADPFAYNHETLTLLQTMGGTLTALIQNQQLLEQLQETNEQLRELDRIKSEFLANMSHELRTPLNSIIGFSRVILKGIDGPLTEMQEQDLTTIYNSGQHLLNLINDILDQAKIAAGKMEIKPDYFDIKAVVEGVRSIGIGLVKDKPDYHQSRGRIGHANVYGDEFRTRQVLLNLVSNAPSSPSRARSPSASTAASTATPASRWCASMCPTPVSVLPKRTCRCCSRRSADRLVADAHVWAAPVWACRSPSR
jgi:GAF domain-containing protein